jgi:hypothetical protein
LVGEVQPSVEWCRVGALVLEEEIDEHRRRAAADGGEQEIAVPASEMFFDVAAGADGESRPVDAGGDRGREEPAELAGRVLGLGEDGLEESVVRGRRLHARSMPERERGG